LWQLTAGAAELAVDPVNVSLLEIVVDEEWLRERASFVGVDDEEPDCFRSLVPHEDEKDC
jgi:hypothetical protein